MRILAVVHAFPPEGCGGTERYADAIARGLQARGHAVEVFAGSLEWRERFEVVRADEPGSIGGAPALPVTRVHRSDLYFDHWDKGAHPHVARAFEQTLARFRPDVIHLHQWIRLSNDIVRRAAARGIPTLLHLHDLFVTCPRVFRMRPPPGAASAASNAPAAPDDIVSCDEPLGRSACTSCVPRWKFQRDGEIGASIDFYAREFAGELSAAAARVAPTRSHAELVARHSPVKPLAIDVLGHPRLPGGIQGPGRDAKSPAGRLRLLYFSHLLPMKGAHVVLQAMRQLGSGGSQGGVSLDAHGAFGSKEYEARLRELASGLEVRFHGSYAVDEPSRTPADVAILPTLARESWSFWLDEAGRLGLPILAADSGAIAERATGRVRLYPARDVAGLAAALVELRDDPARRRALAAAPAPESTPLDVHLAALEARLEEAVRSGAPKVAPPPPPEALEHEHERREIAFRELLRSEGWEEALRWQRAEIERLERDLAQLRGGKAEATTGPGAEGGGAPPT